MSDEPGNAVVVGLELPAGSVMSSAVLVVGYFDTEGGSCYGFATQGESVLSTDVGLLELVKHHLIRDANGEGS